MNPIALLDYAGVAVFAATGALAASRKQLDIIGFLFLASVTGIGGDAESDPMYDQACEVVLKHRRASISLVQRHLRIGYNRAARLLEQMEQSGVVSAMASNGNREILVPNREGE